MPANSLSKPSYQRAFTLTEVLVVLGIIIVAALISVPLFRVGQKSMELKSAARLFVTHLRLAQQRTVGEQTTYLIKILSIPDRYQLLQRTTSDTLILEQKLTNGVTWQDQGGFTNNEIIFTINGAVAQSGTVVFQNTSNQTISVDIKPSGYVKIN